MDALAHERIIRGQHNVTRVHEISEACSSHVPLVMTSWVPQCTKQNLEGLCVRERKHFSAGQLFHSRILVRGKHWFTHPCAESCEKERKKETTLRDALTWLPIRNWLGGPGFPRDPALRSCRTTRFRYESHV